MVDCPRSSEYVHVVAVRPPNPHRVRPSCRLAGGWFGCGATPLGEPLQHPEGGGTCTSGGVVQATCCGGGAGPGLPPLCASVAPPGERILPSEGHTRPLGQGAPGIAQTWLSSLDILASRSTETSHGSTVGPSLASPCPSARRHRNPRATHHPGARRCPTSPLATPNPPARRNPEHDRRHHPREARPRTTGRARHRRPLPNRRHCNEEMGCAEQCRQRRPPSKYTAVPRSRFPPPGSSREPATGIVPSTTQLPPRLHHDTRTGIAPVNDQIPSNNPTASPSVTANALKGASGSRRRSRPGYRVAGRWGRS